MSRKAQGMSLNTIIIAILVLIVLVVLILLFTGNLKIFGWGTQTCESKGGTCVGTGQTGCVSLVDNSAVTPVTLGVTCNDKRKDNLICCPAGSTPK